MHDLSILEDIIYPAMDDMAAAGMIPKIARAPDTPLMGEGRQMDSLQSVSLIIAVERRVQKSFGRAVTLADERAMSRTRSPFLTLETLAEYVAEVLNES
jgi:hypothetical protein